MKTIEKHNDLAINGALPAFQEMLHVGRPFLGNRDLFKKYVEEIFDRRWFTNDGPLVQQFEQQIAEAHDVAHCVAMCNGTVALEIAIRALNLSGEVIIPSYTFIATAHALSWQSIMPVFADIDQRTHNLDPHAVRNMITPKTSGIIGVHLWGRAAPVQALQEIADENNIMLLFDAAHAFDCSHEGVKIGNFGECEILSFHATKIFNTFEGGAVLTNDNDLAEKMQLMRNFGFAGLDNVIHPGTNGKMTEIAAAQGLVNLESVQDFVQINRDNYNLYHEYLSSLNHIKLIKFDEDEDNNFQYIVVEVGANCPVSRDYILTALHKENIRARKYFWPGCHQMMPYRELYPHADLLLANTRQVVDRVIVLPSGEAVNEESIRVITKILSILTSS